MDSAPQLETVLQALHALYHGDNVGGKEKASLWLGELQKSVFAWQISDQLLQLNQDIESCYFAAQTMRTKIQYAFHELPPTSHQSLRDSLLNHCSNVSHETPHVIVTQLCLALADLVLQMCSWRSAADELIRRFGCEVKHLTFLIEFLSLLPEEIDTRPLRLGANRRDEVTRELQSSSELLVQFLTAVLESAADDAKIHGQVLHCLGSWLSAFLIPQNCLVSSPLMILPFNALMLKDCPSELHHSATECLCSSLLAVENSEKNLPLAKLLFDGILSLAEMYDTYVSAEDTERAMNYCRLFTELGETFLESLLSTPNQNFGDFQILELLLHCIAHKHYEVAEVTFVFWNKLSESLYEISHEKALEPFKPYIERLIVGLGKHCQYDASMENILDEPDDFEDFRNRSFELISDVTFIVGPASVCYEMLKILKGDGSGLSWEVTEASLFVMSAVAKHLPSNESDIVPHVLTAILNLPESAHLSIRQTSLRLLGALREWIEKHPEYLESVFQYLLSGLQHPKLASAAAEAIQELCSQCPELMTSLFGRLLPIVQSIETLSISNDATILLLKGAARILSKMPTDSIAEGLRQLCSVQADQLNKILEGEDLRDTLRTKQFDPTIFLDRLAAIFRYISPTVENGKVHPCQEVIQQVWPVISNTFYKYSSDVRVIERCCRCVRFAVRCLGINSTELLNPLITQIVILYQMFPHSCCLYLGSILVDEYGGKAECVPILLEMFQTFCGSSFKMLNEPFGLRNHPDIVDDLFRLCYRFILRSPLAFLRCSLIASILNCAILGFCLDHKEANESICKFMIEFIRHATIPQEETESSQQVQSLVTEVLLKNGQEISNGILKACLFCLPTFMLHDSSEILYELMLIDRPSVCKWLEVTLRALPTHTPGGAITATTKQLQDFHKTVTSAEDLKQVTKSIREFTRLYR